MEKKHKLIYWYFILLPFLDLLTSLLTNYTELILSPGMLIKGLTLLFCIYFPIFKSDSKYKKISILYLIVLLVFGGLYIGLKPDIWNVPNLISEVKFAFKYFYYPIMIIGCINLFDTYKIDNKLLKKVFVINAITYSLLILIPYVTGTSFSSYYSDDLYAGVKGWFYAANEIGVILALLLLSAYYLLDINKKWKVILILPLMISLSLIGTKVSFIGLIIVSLLTLIVFIIKNKKKSLLLSLIFVIFLGAAISFSSFRENFVSLTNSYEEKVQENEQHKKPGANKGDKEDSKKPSKGNKQDDKNTSKLDKDNNKHNDVESVVDTTIYLSDIIPNPLLLKTTMLLLNGRDEFFIDNLNVFIKSDFVNKTFGIGWSNRDSIDYHMNNKLIEIDILDIFIHYGWLGFIIYFVPLIYFIFKIIINIKKLSLESWLYLLILFLGLAVSCIAGHVLSAPAVTIYLILLMYMIKNNIRNEEAL